MAALWPYGPMMATLWPMMAALWPIGGLSPSLLLPCAKCMCGHWPSLCAPMCQMHAWPLAITTRSHVPNACAWPLAIAARAPMCQMHAWPLVIAARSHVPNACALPCAKCMRGHWPSLLLPCGVACVRMHLAHRSSGDGQVAVHWSARSDRHIAAHVFCTCFLRSMYITFNAMPKRTRNSFY